MRAALVISLVGSLALLAGAEERSNEVDKPHPTTAPLVDALEFSWDHPVVQRMLWEGRNDTHHEKKEKPRRIIKRTTISGQQIGGKHCLGCAGGMRPAQPTINDLTTDYLEQWIMRSDRDLRNRCVFYTGITRAETPLWSLDSLGNRLGLGKTAASFACNKGMYSIWVRQLL